ncbi:MAG TPA: efflux RND transporter periplasmic adaptor subunit [Candidatus Limnocylindria bacterium]|nr:efflux RND transporter periplasmic adaptor subunit [Candidatus Limnocylindria bacterium]
MRAALGVVAVLVVGLLVGFVLGAGTTAGEPPTQPPATITATPRPTPRPTPQPTPVDRAIVAQAVVVPARSADLSVAATGRVAAVLVRPDQEVAANQLLLRLDASARRAAVDVAGADVERAQAAVERAQLLLDLLGEDATPAQIEAAEADVRLAEAELEVALSALAQAEVALGQTELRAPFAGTVVSIDVNEGEQAVAGQPVLTLADMSAWFVRTTDLDELQVVRVSVGDRATVTFDAWEDAQLDGRVSRIQVRGTADGTGVRFDVLIEPEEHWPQLRWNMSATVRITPAD